ncbi:hypothetical protein D3C86_1183240 [compost metagenome]
MLIWPPTRSISAGPEPRYGTCTIDTPAVVLKSSAARWLDVPWPLEANEYFSGSFFSRATNSCRLAAGTDWFTDITLGIVATTVSGVKSLTAS